MPRRGRRRGYPCLSLGCSSSQVLALSTLLCPLRVSAFVFELPSSVLSFPRASSALNPISARSNLGRRTSWPWGYKVESRSSSGRTWTVPKRAIGGTDGSGKVYRADDVLVSESDITAARPYDECDLSDGALGTNYGGRRNSDTNNFDNKGGGKDRKPGKKSDDTGGEGRRKNSDRFHVHFGAGRLGLGLVVGAIVRSETPFAIVQRPKTSWSTITSHGCGAQIELQVNRKPIAADVTVISEDCDVQEYLKMGRAALAVVGDRDTLLQLIHKATSFSCSLGSAMKKAMVPLLSELPERPDSELPILYACENDHGMVKRVGELVSSKVNTVPCMVDRICTGRQIEEFAINVEAEPKFEGSLVVLKPPSDRSLVPFAGEHVFLPRDEDEASYFYKRKFSIVNGMHTVLAFMTLREKAPGARECREEELLTYETAPDKLKKEMWAWVVIRSLALLEEYGVDMIKGAHGVQTEEQVFDALLDYANQALSRFSSIVDTTSRVLGGGLGNRWATRLRPIVEFMKQHPMKGSGSAGERFLEYAGVDEEYAMQTTATLMRESVQFCTKEVQACVVDLMEFMEEYDRSHPMYGFTIEEKRNRLAKVTAAREAKIKAEAALAKADKDVAKAEKSLAQFEEALKNGGKIEFSRPIPQSSEASSVP